jgi:hypothetical protein
MLLACEKDIAEKVDLRNLAKVWSGIKHRRIELAQLSCPFFAQRYACNSLILIVHDNKRLILLKVC